MANVRKLQVYVHLCDTTLSDTVLSFAAGANVADDHGSLGLGLSSRDRNDACSIMPPFSRSRGTGGAASGCGTAAPRAADRAERRWCEVPYEARVHDGPAGCGAADDRPRCHHLRRERPG